MGTAKSQVNDLEVIKLRQQGLSMRKIADRLGYSFKQVRNVVDRHHRNPEKIKSNTKVILRKNRLDNNSLLPRGLE